jgi:hypothetical protein
VWTRQGSPLLPERSFRNEGHGRPGGGESGMTRRPCGSVVVTPWLRSVALCVVSMYVGGSGSMRFSKHEATGYNLHKNDVR